MKRRYKIIIELLLIIILAYVGYWFYFYSGLNQILINLILLNILIYIVRTFLINFVNAIIKNRIFKFTFSLIVNLIWIIFLFTLLFFISPTFTISIISFLIIAISLTFQDVINNIASGLMIISKEDVEIGDLVEINGIQGIIKEINLNYTVIEDFDGTLTYIPNRIVYNASVVKFTHRRLKIGKSADERRKLMRYVKDFSKFLSRGKKLTNYTKIVEITSAVNPDELEALLSSVFDKYQPIFGIRPDYVIEKTALDRCVITLLVMSKEPILVIKYLDNFLKDIVYKLYSNKIAGG
ncbi:MAG: mechanosensitive ion channel domain-containing protein [Candidatus Hodarchaeota archaeon]